MPDPQEAPLQVTSPESWGTAAKVDGDIKELPSGHVAKIRRTLSLLRIVQDGSIPNPLRGIIMGMVKTGSMNMPAEAQNDSRIIMQMGDFLDMIAMEVMVEPPLDRPIPMGKLTDDSGAFIKPDETEDEYFDRLQTWVPKAGHLSIFALDAADKMFLFVYAQGGAADAKQFREFQAASVANLEGGEEPVLPTKRTGGTGTKRKSKPKPKGK